MNDVELMTEHVHRETGFDRQNGFAADARARLLAHGWFIGDCVGWCWRCNELILPGQAIRYEVDAQAGSVRGECCAPAEWKVAAA